MSHTRRRAYLATLGDAELLHHAAAYRRHWLALRDLGAERWELSAADGAYLDCVMAAGERGLPRFMARAHALLTPDERARAARYQGRRPEARPAVYEVGAPRVAGEDDGEAG